MRVWYLKAHMHGIDFPFAEGESPHSLWWGRRIKKMTQDWREVKNHLREWFFKNLCHTFYVLIEEESAIFYPNVVCVDGGVGESGKVNQ